MVVDTILIGPRSACQDFGANFAAQTVADGLDRAIAVLRGLALVTSESVPDERDAGLRTEALRLHRLVRQIVGATLAAGSIATGRAALTAALVRVYPANVFDSAPTWPLARRLDALAMAMVAPPGRSRRVPNQTQATC